MEDFFNALPRLIWHEDEPITWPSSVSLYFVSKLAREHVKVVLTGEGSDEMFGGYARYRHYADESALAAPLPHPARAVRSAIRSQVATTPLLSATLRRKLQHTFVGRGEDLESLYLDNFYSAFSAAEQRALFTQPAAARSPYANFRRYWDSQPDLPTLARMLFADQKTYLVELLMKQDQMSMATSHRKPRAVPRSRVRRVLHARAGAHEAAQWRRQIHRQEGHRRPGPARNHLPQEDGLSHAAAPVAPRPPRRRPLRHHARQGRTAGVIHRPRRARQAARTSRTSGREDATDRIWRLLTLQLWGDMFLTGKREERWDGVMAAARPAV